MENPSVVLRLSKSIVPLSCSFPAPDCRGVPLRCGKGTCAPNCFHCRTRIETKWEASPRVSVEAVRKALEETRREASASALPLQGVVFLKLLTFLPTTALQRLNGLCLLDQACFSVVAPVLRKWGDARRSAARIGADDTRPRHASHVEISGTRKTTNAARDGVARRHSREFGCWVAGQSSMYVQGGWRTGAGRNRFQKTAFCGRGDMVDSPP